MDRKRAAHQALVDRVLGGAGAASAQERARAFGNNGLPPPLGPLIDKVAARPAQATDPGHVAGFDADFAAAKEAGFAEDQIFELVVCAAVGQSARLYDAGLAALAEAVDDGSAGHAT